MIYINAFNRMEINLLSDSRFSFEKKICYTEYLMYWAGISLGNFVSVFSFDSALRYWLFSSCMTVFSLLFFYFFPEYVTYEFIPTSPAVSRMSGSSNLGSFLDG